MAKYAMALSALLLALSAVPATTWADDSTTATPQEVVTKVREAVQYLNAKGLAGFSDFNNNKDARWVWKDSYVFVYSCRDDVMIAHPLRPDLVGKPVLQMRDDKDHPIFQDLCKAGEKPHGGWVEYWWPKPGEARASRKISYAHSAPVSFKSDIQVAAGIYDDKLTPDELDQIANDASKPQKAVP